MTDNEIAEEYICNGKCQDDITKNYVHCENCTRIKDFLAGLEAGRPRLHKVAAGDLPKETGDYITNIGVLTYDSYGDGVFRWHTPFCEACDYADVVGDDEVIAWCEIPKYIEEVSK